MRLNQSRENEEAGEGGLRTHVIVSSPSSSRMLDLEEGVKLLIGRSPEVEICVDDPLVSRLHTQIERRSGGIYIQDRGSANGTWLNGRSIEGEALLRPGDELKVGATVLTVVETSPPPSYNRDILPPDKLMDRFDHELVSSRQDGEPLVLVLVLPGRIPAPLDLLQRRLLDLMSAGDSLGHGPDGELLLLKPGDSRRHAEMRVRKLVEKTVEKEVSVQGIGVAVFPDDGMKSGDLMDVARIAAGNQEWRRMSRPPAPLDPLARSVTLIDGVSTHPDPAKEFIVGDPAMLNLMKTARKVAMSDAPVLVTGETGAGKEVLARYIHRASNRAEGPLVKVNCATLPPALIEAELFGHEKGAFTGADERRVGFLESANLGTVILDEITELPGSVQVKLLRFLDDYTINRVGMTEEVLLDVRVIALTNRDVEEEIRIGSFRQDLFYRLGTFHLYIPPLRSRHGDIPLLAEYFAQRVAQRFEMPTPVLGRQFQERLISHAWPGNVRELRNAMEASVIQCEDEVLSPEHLPVTVTSKVVTEGKASQVPGKMKQRKAEAEAEEIRKALATTGGVQKAAAEILGISRRTLWSKIKRYGIEFKKGG